MPVLQPLGRAVLKFLPAVGRLLLFASAGLSHIFRPPYYPRLVFRQMMEIGYYSLPVVGIPQVVVISITRELGPVLAGLMVAGRIGAAMAAELGTMRVTEQIEALVTLATNPMKYLVAPRLLAGITMLPLLVLIAMIIGVFGGYLVSIYKLGFNPSSYLNHTLDILATMDVVSGLVKAAVFGFIVTLMGCYHGYNSRGGAQGVGQATTNAVVSASILILLSNYFITEMFFAR